MTRPLRIARSFPCACPERRSSSAIAVPVRGAGEP
jgi:hypothetical protein